MPRMTRPSLKLNLSLMSDGALAPAVHPELWALVALLDGATDEPSAAIDPAAAFGVSGGAGLLTVAFRDTRAARSTLHLTGWNPFQTGLLGGLERLGAHAVVRESGRRRRATRNLDEALADGATAAVWVDGAALGLAPAALQGMSPTVVVARAHADGDAVDVSDGTMAVSVDRASLETARHANAAHRTRVVTLGPGALADTAQITRRGLATTAVGPLGGPPGASGAEGLRAFADVVATDDAWVDVFPDDAAFIGALVALHAAATGEDGLLRRHQAAFVELALDVDGIGPAGADLPDRYRSLADEWDAVAAAALPADVPELAALRQVRSAHELLPGAAETPFPLPAGEASELRAALAARLTALAEAEDGVLESLRAALRSG